jgi:hypothetical protein
MIHCAELRVHFLKSFQKGSTCENLSQKGLKIKKVGPSHMKTFTFIGAHVFQIALAPAKPVDPLKNILYAERAV